MKPTATKSVLVLTYYWPPAGGPGVQRVLKFCKYLPHFGWRPVVLTVKDGEYPALDPSLEKDTAPDLVVHRTPSLEPFALYRLLTGKRRIETFVLTEDSHGTPAQRLAAFVRGNLFIPDGRIGWKPFAVRRGMKIIEKERIDVIFSTAPPMSTHLIARSLARRSGLPWAADFRDPWTDVFYYHTLKRLAPAVRLDRRLEKTVISKADAVVTVSPTIKNLLQKKAENDYYVIPNGFDPEDFKDVEPLPDDGKLHLVHAGHLAINQNPRPLWRAFYKLAQETGRLSIDFYGSIHSDIRNELKEIGLLPNCTFFGYRPHEEVVGAMKRAAVLFFIVPETSYAAGIPTSKLFDYMGAGRPILGYGPQNGDAAFFLNQSGAGMMADESDVEETLRRVLVLRPAGDRVDAFSRLHRTAELAQLFDNLIDSSNQRRKR